jgi:hypothetical protein
MLRVAAAAAIVAVALGGSGCAFSCSGDGAGSAARPGGESWTVASGSSTTGSATATTAVDTASTTTATSAQDPAGNPGDPVFIDVPAGDDADSDAEPAVTTDSVATISTLQMVAPTVGRVPLKTRYEDTDPHILYSQGVLRVESSDASGGASSAISSGTMVTIPFKGTSISLRCLTSRYSGIARIIVDDRVYQVDTFADLDMAGAVYKTVWTSPSLPYATHILLLEYNGAANPGVDDAIARPSIYLDAVDIIGTIGN